MSFVCLGVDLSTIGLGFSSLGVLIFVGSQKDMVSSVGLLGLGGFWGFG